MDKIYVNQSELRLILNTGVTITGADPVYIKYKKPDGTLGSLTATISGTTSVYYDLTNDEGDSELDQSGLWLFWAHVTFSDGRIGIGEAVPIKVYTESN